MTYAPKEARALMDTPTTLDPHEMARDLSHTGELSMVYRCIIADTLTAALDEIERLREALTECRHEIDEYIRQEYPADHPVHERYRQRDFAANPARIALKGYDQ